MHGPAGKIREMGKNLLLNSQRTDHLTQFYELLNRDRAQSRWRSQAVGVLRAYGLAAAGCLFLSRGG